MDAVGIGKKERKKVQSKSPRKHLKQDIKAQSFVKKIIAEKIIIIICILFSSYITINNNKRIHYSIL